MRSLPKGAAFAVLLAVALAGTGQVARADGPTVYQPSSMSKSGAGYYETQLDVNRLRIVFTGESGADRQSVEDNLLYRAAEVTVQRGFDSFLVVDHFTDQRSEAARKGPPLPPLPLGPGRNKESVRYAATSEIIMMKGTAPADQVTAYDARVTMENLRWRITRR